MRLDTSSYYPKSPLDDDPELNEEAHIAEGPDLPDAKVAADTDEVKDSTEVKTFKPEEKQLPPTEVESAVTGIAHLLSWVLVPLLMPVYGVMLAFGLSILMFTSFGTRLAFTAIVAGLNVVIPALIVMLLKKAKVVNDVGLNNRQERFLPFLTGIICLVSTAIFLHFKGAPLWLTLFFYGGATAGLVEVIINNWWKISVHAAGMAGIVALLLHLSFADYHAPSTDTWLLISIGLTGLLGAARIWLGRHTLGQVLAGYAVGFCSVFFIMLI